MSISLIKHQGTGVIISAVYYVALDRTVEMPPAIRNELTHGPRRKRGKGKFKKDWQK